MRSLGRPRVTQRHEETFIDALGDRNEIRSGGHKTEIMAPTDSERRISMLVVVLGHAWREGEVAAVVAYEWRRTQALTGS